MIIERNFHDEFQRQIKEIDEKLAREQMTMTQEQRLAEEKQRSEEIRRITDEIEAAEQGKRRLPEPLLESRFRGLVGAAMRLGEHCGLNVRAERRGRTAVYLNLESTLFVLGGSTEKELAALTRNAREILLSVNGDFVRMSVEYDLRCME